MTLSESTIATMPRNFLRPCLLLSLAEGTAHGYELLDRVTALGLTNADPGSLYRCLRAMDDEGLIESSWEPSSQGPARRKYELTGDGQEALDHAARSLAELATVLARFEERHRQAAAERSP